MQLLKSKAYLILFLALAMILQVFSNEKDANPNQKTDAITDAKDKVESLINKSKKFEDISQQLSMELIAEANYIAITSNRDDLIIQCDHQKGIVLSKNNKLDEALINLKKALSYYSNRGDKMNAGRTLVDIGKAYTFNSIIKKALIFFNSALAEYSEIKDTLGIALCYTNIGQCYMALNQNNTAIKFISDAIQISKTNHYEYYLSLNYINLSRIQLTMGLTDDVPTLINSTLEIANQESFVELESESYLLLGRYYTSIGNKVEASKQLSNYIRLNDSLNNHESTELENYLIELGKNTTPSKSKLVLTIFFWIILVVVCMVIIITLIKIRNKKKLHESSLKKSNSELEAFNANLVDQEEKIELKTKEKFIEIEQDIKNNHTNKTALAESLKNVEQVNHLKDRFLSKISHEIRTPLNSILGFSSILETELALLEDNSLFEFSNSITQSGHSLVTLLNNILDISRLNSDNMALDIKKLNTNELIQRVVDTYTTEASLKGIKLIYASQTIPEISTDSQLFSKILSLILDNSVKFTEKGFIKISHEFDENQNMINIFIKDTGIGIDKVYIDQVFEPFRQESLGYSKSFQGAGLGLPLAKKMTIKLEGNISLESEKGNGTTIILSFPAFISKKEIETPAIPQKDQLPWEPLKVLVVEDDNMNQILYRKMLSKAHYLEIAKDGKTALSIVEKQLKDGNFHLVLMDINLPAPWDGISLMKEIRNRWPVYKDIPFIAQTAYAMSGNRKSMMDEGFDDYITKPIIKSTLIESIKSVIAK